MADAPVPVSIQAPNPIPVEVVAGTSASAAPSQRVQQQSIDPSVPAKTTFQEDLITAGQRRVNLIWEYTQAAIALLVVATTMVAGLYTMFYPTVMVGIGANLVAVPTTIPTVIGVAFGMVTGFYFSRTNHEKVGGVGPKMQSHYEGR